LPTRFKLT